MRVLFVVWVFGFCVSAAVGQSIEQSDEPAANPARPTVSNPATLIPVGYLQFETGTLGASTSPEFSTRYEFNEVVKLAVHRVFSSSNLLSLPSITLSEGVTANGTAEVFLGRAVV